VICNLIKFVYFFLNFWIYLKFSQFFFRCGQKSVDGPAWYSSASTSRCSNDTSWDPVGGGGGDRLAWTLVKQLIGKTGVFLHPMVQAICYKKPVERLNSCQTIVRQKKLIFPYYCTGIEQTIFKKIDCVSKQFVKHLTKLPEFKILTFHRQ
jgi:hypothetical protein